MSTESVKIISCSSDDLLSTQANEKFRVKSERIFKMMFLKLCLLSLEQWNFIAIREIVINSISEDGT